MKKDFIIGWFAENSTLSREELEKDLTINYLESGVIDSFGFLDLISACEEKLGITFSDDDFSDDRIFTIAGLIDIITEK
jgi:acyl carrier protein